MFDKEALQLHLPEYVEQITKTSGRKHYVCPICGSGSKRKKTGAFYIYEDKFFKCFSCNTFGDIFDLVGAIEHLDKKAAFRRVAEMYGEAPIPQKKPKRTKKVNTKDLFKDYINQCFADRGETDYFAKRGFSEKDVERFSLGYDKKNDAIVIPYSKANAYYIRRNVKRKAFYKPPADIAGPEPVYNQAALKEKKVCFICESPIDAISIMSASDYSAIAIGGTGITKLLEYIDKYGVKAPLVVSLDDDEDSERNVGRDTAKELMGELAVRRIPFVFASYSKDKYPKSRRKDANDMFVSNRDMFIKDLDSNATTAEFFRFLQRKGMI